MVPQALSEASTGGQLWQSRTLLYRMLQEEGLTNSEMRTLAEIELPSEDGRGPMVPKGKRRRTVSSSSSLVLPQYEYLANPRI